MIRNNREGHPDPAGQVDSSQRAPVLAIDIGNTATSAGAVIGEQVHDSITVETRRFSDLAGHLAEAWNKIASSPQARAVIGSVVPERTDEMCRLIEQATGTEALVIRQGLPLPMELAVDNPDKVGVDRVCCAAAAYDRLRQACVVADFGTAVTIDLVSDDGVFMGGVILPGAATAAASLAEHAAALPKVRLRRPPRLIGRNTQEAILSGIVYGLAGALREIVERYATELGKWPQLIVTGGGANLIAEHCDFIDNVVPNLSLLGVALAWRATLER